MHHAFQDRANLFLTMDFYEGGDLRYHIHHKVKFTEQQISMLNIYYQYKRVYNLFSYTWNRIFTL
jgi:hypothetical protein